MGDNYRPRRSPPFPPRHGGGWQNDYERPPRGAYYRDASTSRERRISSDFYDERQPRPSSSRSS
ncbi:hypothetical protein KC352_g40687, partial [Hortaea werneckii]